MSRPSSLPPFALPALPALLAAAVALFSACSLDYERARVEESLAGQTPQTVLLDFTHTVVSRGRVWVILEASRAETFGESKTVVLRDVHFREFDEQGELVTEARAERAVFHSDTEDAELQGSITIYSPEEGGSLQADRLSWTHAGRRLAAGEGMAVRLEKDDGSFVEGLGFSADFRRKKLEFSSRVRGSYVWKDESNEPQ